MAGHHAAAPATQCRMPRSSIRTTGAGRSRSGKGSLTLLTFIYTRCPLPNLLPADGPELRDDSAARSPRMPVAARQGPARVGLVRSRTSTRRRSWRAHAAQRKADPAVWTFLTGDRADGRTFAATIRRRRHAPRRTSDGDHAQSADGARRRRRPHPARSTPATSGRPATVLDGPARRRPRGRDRRRAAAIGRSRPPNGG